jgi:PAS domain S-box-containing protein
MTSSSKPVRILCAEDDPATARLLEKRLKNLGHSVSIASNGEVALTMWDSGSYDLLIVDHDMPKKRGTEVIQTLCMRGSLPPIIMVTGMGNEDIAVEAMKLGISDYLVKDGQGKYLELIHDKIEEALSMHRLREEEKKAAQELEKSHQELEVRVVEGAAALEKTSEELRVQSKGRERAEEMHLESEERFRAIFESAQDCIYLKDRSLRYTLVNPYMESFLGLGASDIIGRTDEDLFGPLAGRIVCEQEYSVLKGETRQLEQTRKVRGENVAFLDTKVPLRGSRGTVIGICGISRDISDRSKLPRAPLPATPEEYTSAAMRAALEQALQVASTDTTVLLTGESGCGKDYLARFLHDNSRRTSGPYHTINCAAVPQDLAEAELFGHSPGAFTGASRQAKKGQLELAEGGTLLLNEIGELPLLLQAKLLTFLDTREFTPVGGVKTRKVNSRLIAATNRDLQEEVSCGRFRSDLFHRLNVFCIPVPPLRDRVEDIPILVRKLTTTLETELQLPPCGEIDAESMNALKQYRWPGNVRELRNVLERGMILSQGGPLTEHCLRLTGEGDWSVTVGFPQGQTLDDLLGDLKRSFFEEALRRSGGKKVEAARLLGISRFVFTRHLKSLDCSDVE